MSQTRKGSATEAVANVAIGYLVAVGSQVAIFPIFGIKVPLATNFAIGVYFTVISLARSYAVRRWFNAKASE